MNAKTIVAYYRVSTRQQARSGLGLLAQQDAIRRYVVANRCKVLAELTEVESGRDNGRPKLRKLFGSAGSMTPNSSLQGLIGWLEALR
jgi:DNA invertase Pin-like site-specific DNA recombinase